MKMISTVLGLFITAHAQAAFEPCDEKVALFSKAFAIQYTNFTSQDIKASVHVSEAGDLANVSIFNSDFGLTRDLVVKLGGNCSIFGVESVGVELNMLPVPL